MAWSYLEMLSEKTLWGILGLNDTLAEAFVWRMQLSSKWQAIKREARKALPEADYFALKALGTAVEACARDRNIVVHGVVHAMAKIDGPKPPSGTVIGSHEEPPNFVVQPCWTIFMGEDAGKNFLISSEAVEIITKNVQSVAQRILAFNQEHNFNAGTSMKSALEAGWPKPL